MHLDKTPERDGRTDRQNWFGYYSGLHCKQCGRAVKWLTVSRSLVFGMEAAISLSYSVL